MGHDARHGAGAGPGARAGPRRRGRDRPSHSGRGSASGGVAVQRHLLQGPCFRRPGAVGGGMVGGGRRVLHLLFRLHQPDRLSPRLAPSAGGVFAPGSPGRGVALPGLVDSGVRHCGHRQHRRGGGRHFLGRPWRHLLDDRCRLPGHVHQVCRVRIRHDLPPGKPGRQRVRRPHVLPQARPCRARLALVGQGLGRVLRLGDRDRLPRHRQYVPVEPGLSSVCHRHRRP